MEKAKGETPRSGETDAATEQPSREWVTPQFESIPLKEAMGPILHHVVQDGANLYS